MPTIDFTNVMKNKTDYLSYEEIDSMLQYCYNLGNMRNYFLILTLYRTGRRITEIVGERPYNKKVGFRPCDIMPDGLIEFDILKKNPIKTTTKAGLQRSEELVMRERLSKMPKRVLMPVDREYFELINDYINSNFVSKYDRIFSITDRRARYIIDDVAKACNIRRANSKIHPHSFRHSFAIHLLKANPNDASTIKQVSDLLAHSDIKITMDSYAKFTQEDKKDMLDNSFGS